MTTTGLSKRAAQRVTQWYRTATTLLTRIFWLAWKALVKSCCCSLIRRWQTHIGSFSWGASHLCHPCLYVSLVACFVIRPWKRRSKRIGLKIYEANRRPVCAVLLNHQGPIHQQRKSVTTYHYAL